MMRKLELASGTWRYKVGVSGAQIRGPGGESLNVSAHDLNGRTPGNLERGRDKKTTDGMVTPGDVRRYIERVVLGGAER